MKRHYSTVNSLPLQASVNDVLTKIRLH